MSTKKNIEKEEEMSGTNNLENDDVNVSKERSKSLISVTFNQLKDHIMSSKPKKRRLLGKKGALKVKALNTKGGLYFSDLFTTLVDADWKWIMAFFALSYIVSWLLFGLLWFAVFKSRKPGECLMEVNSFASALLFSIETQTTIGYGGRSITPVCPDAIIILMIQSLTGLFMSAVLLGLVFTKLARPSKRADTLLFTKNAVIAPRDGKLCMMFRVGDIRESRILNAEIRVQLFRTRRTAEGQDIPFYQQDLKCGIDWSDKGSGNNSLFLVLPLTIVHVIDEESPFYEMGPNDFNSIADFEVVAILSGMVESTSMLVEARTSYLGDEILWAQEFLEVLHEESWDAQKGKYLVDFSSFDHTVPVQHPKLSAKEFYKRQDEEVHKVIKAARSSSRRILSRHDRENTLAKRYMDLWVRKYTLIQEEGRRKNSYEKTIETTSSSRTVTGVRTFKVTPQSGSQNLI